MRCLGKLWQASVGRRWGSREGRGRGRPSDFDLCPEGLLDVLCMWVASCSDGEAAVLPQGRGHRCGVHILRQLALVSEGVHDRAVSSQLLSSDLDVVVGRGNDDVFRGEVAHIHCKLIGISKCLDVARSPRAGWEGQGL